jgi:hypothetical protein
VSTPRPKETVQHARQTLDLRDPFWPAQLTVAFAIALQISLPDKLSLGPNWLLPSAEGLLLIGLIVATPHPDIKHSPIRRQIAVTLIGVVSLVNLISLFLLAHYLTVGSHHSAVGGRALIDAGIALWVTNVLLFGLWYWELDRGGPVTRALEPDTPPDFLFVQMQEPRHAPPDWMPGFLDYMYTSFTNATAFSPTDTMPLTYMAKVLMAVQSLAALVTIGLVVSRAVNILQ